MKTISYGKWVRMTKPQLIHLYEQYRVFWTPEDPSVLGLLPRKAIEVVDTESTGVDLEFAHAVADLRGAV